MQVVLLLAPQIAMVIQINSQVRELVGAVARDLSVNCANCPAQWARPKIINNKVTQISHQRLTNMHILLLPPWVPGRLVSKGFHCKICS